MHQQFKQLRETLLKEGIARRHAHRYAMELSHHYDDIRDRLVAIGHSQAHAAMLAAHRLGSTEQLAEAMLAAPRLRSRIADAPLLTLIIAPATFLILSLFISIAALALFCDRLPPVKAELIGDCVEVLCCHILPTVSGWVVAMLATRQRINAFWPVLSLCILAALGSLVDTATIMPGPECPSMVHFNIFLRIENFSSFVNYLLLTLTPYWLLLQWRELLRYRSHADRPQHLKVS